MRCGGWNVEHHDPAQSSPVTAKKMGLEVLKVTPQQRYSPKAHQVCLMPNAPLTATCHKILQEMPRTVCFICQQRGEAIVWGLGSSPIKFYQTESNTFLSLFTKK